MKYYVRNQDGELTFGSIHELRVMFDQGLVGPDDEVRPEDSQSWRKAAAIPELHASAAARRSDASSARFLFITVVCLSAALGVMLTHSSLSILQRTAIAAALMIPVIGMSQRAFTKFLRRERD